MTTRFSTGRFIGWLAAFLLVTAISHFACIAVLVAEEKTEDEPPVEEPFDEGLFPEIPTPGGEGEAPEETLPQEEQKIPVEKPPLPVQAQPEPPTERIEGGEAREGETRWGVNITGAVVLNYVFTDSKNFSVKYRWEVKGEANAETAVIRGDANLNADVEGPLAKWPTGECRLEVSIPKIPFELTFRRTDEDKGNIRLVFKREISEDWQSKCTFADAPNAKFDTRGPPETWLSKALDRAKPPLKDIIADMAKEETTTRFVIPKETINDPPLGNVEIEGTGVITITPGG